MRQAQHEITIRTNGQGLYEATERIHDWLAGQGIRTGLITLFIRHTSASLVIQENADPDVLADLAAFFRRLVPEDTRLYRHNTEGADDMPAHIRAALTETQLQIPVRNGRLALGTWQGVYLFEHRAAPHERRILLHLIGD